MSLSLLTGCTGAKLPACVEELPSHSAALEKKWATPAAAKNVEVAIDGSGSMLGLTGSVEASTAWKAMLRGISLAAASTGLPIQPLRSGSGDIQPIGNINQASDPCFFTGCGAYAAVSSSLVTLWKSDVPKGTEVPLKMLVSDLEVNDGEISGLVSAIKPHVNRGAVIGILAVKLPFDGSVYNSQGQIIHTGKSQRPVYLLATGPRIQVQTFLKDVKSKAALGGAPSDSMKVTFLDEKINRPTLKALSVQGIPPAAISSGLPIRLGSNTFSPAQQSDYQFARLQKGAKGVRLSSSNTAGAASTHLPDVSLGELEPVVLPGDSAVLGAGITSKGMKLSGDQFVVEISIANDSPASAVRLSVPRGRLPDDWWIDWNRRDPKAPSARDQTDGLLLLLTTLGTLLVEPGSTPAAAFCLVFSHS